ncbi:hypothetical protein DPMN_038109, partial [Dreissena polymorpha]
MCTWSHAGSCYENTNYSLRHAEPKLAVNHRISMIVTMTKTIFRKKAMHRQMSR